MNYITEFMIKIDHEFNLLKNMRTVDFIDFFPRSYFFRGSKILFPMHTVTFHVENYVLGVSVVSLW